MTQDNENWKTTGADLSELRSIVTRLRARARATEIVASELIKVLCLSDPKLADQLAANIQETAKALRKTPDRAPDKTHPPLPPTSSVLPADIDTVCRALESVVKTILARTSGNNPQ